MVIYFDEEVNNRIMQAECLNVLIKGIVLANPTEN